MSILPPSLLLHPSSSDTIVPLIRSFFHILAPISLTLQLEPRWADKALEDGSPDVRSQAREVVARLKMEGDRYKLQFSM